MNLIRPLVVVVGLTLCGQWAFAQDVSRYRAYALGSSVDAVVAASGSRAGDTRTLHERPATIRQLEWRAPYVVSRDVQVDPVRSIAFTFYNDALYQVVVSYDRNRTEGLTHVDIIESLTGAYGAPTKTLAGLPPGISPDSVVLARWETAESLLTLTRGSYTPDIQLILISKPLSARARTAVREAITLDAIEAPRREALQREKEADDARATRDKTRSANKAAFRP